jgi:hypothetical protein
MVLFQRDGGNESMNIHTGHSDLEKRLAAAAKFYKPDLAAIPLPLEEIARSLGIELQQVMIGDSATPIGNQRAQFARMKTPSRLASDSNIVEALRVAFRRGGNWPTLEQYAAETPETISKEAIDAQQRYLWAVTKAASEHHEFPTNDKLPGFKGELERMIFSWLRMGWKVVE